MAIIKNIKIDKNLEKKVYSGLLQELEKVNSSDGLDRFLNKFMTPGEKIIFIRRFAVIRLLEQNIKYRDIKKLLDISSGTISNIKDITAGRGYGRNPDRKRKYSGWKTRKKFKKFKRRYKGADSITDLLSLNNDE